MLTFLWLVAILGQRKLRNSPIDLIIREHGCTCVCILRCQIKTVHAMEMVKQNISQHEAKWAGFKAIRGRPRLLGVARSVFSFVVSFVLVYGQSLSQCTLLFLRLGLMPYRSKKKVCAIQLSPPDCSWDWNRDFLQALYPIFTNAPLSQQAVGLAQTHRLKTCPDKCRQTCPTARVPLVEDEKT